jgi:hypothetical protein
MKKDLLETKNLISLTTSSMVYQLASAIFNHEIGHALIMTDAYNTHFDSISSAEADQIVKDFEANRADYHIKYDGITDHGVTQSKSSGQSFEGSRVGVVPYPGGPDADMGKIKKQYSQ